MSIKARFNLVHYKFTMNRWVGKTAIVTGASAGIGLEIVKVLIKHNINVIGLARRVERLTELGKQFTNSDEGKFYAQKCDLGDENEIVKIFDWAGKTLGGVDILINNAGIGIQTTLMEGKTDDWKRTFDTNVIALCVCTREAIKSMKNRKVAGQIVHINSIAGHKVPMTGYHNVYPATKFAVTALTESLRLELLCNNSEIKVSSLSPGLVESEFNQSNDFVPENYKDQFSKRKALKPEHIAQGVVYILSTPPEVQVAELTLRPLDY